MNANIFIEFSENKIKFILNLPFDFIDINEDEYFKYDNTIIFESQDININKIDLNNKIETIVANLKNSFPNENIEIDQNLYMDDSIDKNNKIFYDFIKNNKDLNILLRCDNFKELIKKLGNEEYPNLKISFNNSSEAIPYIEFYKMYSKLYEIIDFILHYNLSPIEQVLLVYDIVKANVYTKETKNQDTSISRDLNKIVNSDKIVCVGFANLIDFLLSNLNFKTKLIRVGYKDKNSTHRRNCIYLEDSKYKINGIFFMDATWDSKKDENYIDNYSYFLKPLRFFSFINKNEYIISPKSFEFAQKSKEELLKHIENLNNEETLRFNVTLINLINRGTDEKLISSCFINSKEEGKKLIDIMYKKYNKFIDKNVFKNALYKVRKMEYLNKIIHFYPDEKYIDSICNRYYKDTKETLLLKAFGIYEDPTLIQSLTEAKADSVEEDLLRISLLKSLKERLNDFPNNDYIKKM